MTTTVPTIRDVKRVRGLWWDADQVGKPLTPSSAFWLRRGMIHRLPMTVARSLARRGLLAGVFSGQDVGLTERGQAIKRLLGTVPPTYTTDLVAAAGPGQLAVQQRPALEKVICRKCGAFTHAELIAWAAEKRMCSACATKGMP